MEHSGECRQQRMPLLLHGSKITADAAKSGGTSRTAKGARNLLLHFRHPQVALRLVVGKRNPQVVEDGQDLLGSCEQGIQQILGLAVFVPPWSLPRCSTGRRGLGGVASSQDLEEASHPLITLDGGHRANTGQAPLLASRMQIQQEVVHLCGPPLLVLLGHPRTIAQEVRSTEAVGTVRGIIACPPVVDAAPSKTPPDADLFHGLCATRRMPREMRQPARDRKSTRLNSSHRTISYAVFCLKKKNNKKANNPKKNKKGYNLHQKKA